MMIDSVGIQSVMFSDTESNNLSLRVFKKGLLLDPTLTGPDAPQDYVAVIAAVLWLSAENIYWTKPLVSMDHSHIHTYKLSAQGLKALDFPFKYMELEPGWTICMASHKVPKVKKYVSTILSKAH